MLNTTSEIFVTSGSYITSNYPFGGWGDRIVFSDSPWPDILNDLINNPDWTGMDGDISGPLSMSSGGTEPLPSPYIPLPIDLISFNATITLDGKHNLGNCDRKE